MRPTLNPNLRDFWTTREIDGGPVRFRTLYGGRMSSKSHDIAGMAIARSNHHTERILCLRMYQNRIADSVYTLLKDKISQFNLSSNFRIYNDAIEHKRNGSLFRFYGIARNVDEIKSFEGATISWTEEAHNVTEEMFNTIRPTIMRNAGAEMWHSFNPRYATDFAYKRLVLNPPKGSLVRKINYDENPFLNATALSDIQSAYEEDYDLAVHTYEGVPYDNNEGVIIKREWIEAALDAHLKLLELNWSDDPVLGYDGADGTSDGSGDNNAVTILKGSVCNHVEEWNAGIDEIYESTQRVLSIGKHHKVSQIGYDSIGVGAGTGSNLNQMGWRRHYKFNAGAKVAYPDKMYDRASKITNQEMFSNLKAQVWWLVADRFRNTYNAVTKGREYQADELISISTDIPERTLTKLIEELSTPFKDFDNNGRVKVESKRDLAKRDVNSPNLADSFIIAAARQLLAKRSILDMLR